MRRRPPPPPRGPYRPSSPDRNDPAAPISAGAAPVRLRRGITIVFEDADVLVVDKPVGIITADPAVGDEGRRPAARAGNTVFDILKAYVRDQPRPRPVRSEGDRARGERRMRDQGVWIIHRLDKEASGLLVFAKSERAFLWLKEDLRAKRVEREYLALAEGVVGKPGEEGTIQTFMKEDGPARSPRPRDARGGARNSGSATSRRDRDPDEPKLAVTHYKIVGADASRTLLRVRLDTGRKNQIRVQFAERGHPLVGDHKFGSKSDPVSRLGLHAAELSFNHPGAGRRMTFTSPAPDSFYRAVGLPPPPSTPASLPAAAPKASAGLPPQAAVAAAHADTQASAAVPIAKPRPAAPLEAAPAAETSWDGVASWYDQLLEDRGNDHYDQVILPGTLRLLEPSRGQRVLDVASGQGILGRRLAAMGVESLGVEASPRLVQAAERRAREEGVESLARYRVGDARGLTGPDLSEFDSATCIMALSNIEPLAPVMAGVAAALKRGGRFIWVITHPAFRAAGQSSWGWDAGAKVQYRRMDGYLSPGQKPITMNPGQAARGQTAETTWTFHRPIQTYVEALARAGLLVERIEEWPSLRASTSGPRAAEENRSRREIPLFLAVRAVKV